MKRDFLNAQREKRSNSAKNPISNAEDNFDNSPKIRKRKNKTHS
jgi:hypothetical protein